MKRMAIAAVLVIVMLGLLSAVAFTAPGPENGSVNVSAAVEKSMWLTVTDNTVDLAGSPGMDTSTDRQAAFNIRANWNWTLQANALATLSGTGADGTTPVSLPGTSIKVEGSPISGNVNVASGGKTASQDVTANYLPDFQWTDSAGTYSGVHTYTLAFN